MPKTTFDTYCGLSCKECELKESCHCGGCIATQGKPFYGDCEVAQCAIKNNRRFCGECPDFPCEILNRYSLDAEHGDNGARIENCKAIKNALVAEAREGVDPIAYCGFSCNNCFLGQWCGSCRSDYNCCSFATISPDGVCAQVKCCRENGYDGCWECDQVETCMKGYYGNEVRGEFACRAAALFIRAHGKEASLKVIAALNAEHLTDCQKFIDSKGSAKAALEFMETYLK